MKVLLVDDDPLALKLLAHQLAGLGLEDVVTHERARDALVWLGQSGAATELIFADLQMPGMDGVEFLRHLSTMAYAGDVVLISSEDRRILQSANDVATRQHLRVLGALAKPASPDQLRAILARRATYAAPDADEAGRAITVGEISKALELGELVNYYEPQIEVATGTVTGVEALVRWHHPARGLIYPGAFIPQVEANDLMEPMTRLVLTEALWQAGQWRSAGLSLRMSVNITMGTLDSLEFPDFVAKEAAKAGVPLSSLVLELTESRMLKGAEMPLDVLTRLRLKQVGLSIDDFGTGHSSLAKLRDIPFSELKIDRGFVRRAATDPSRRAIFDASLAMARRLGLRAVAEGVEDRADWDFVRAAGCDHAQGYFTARAMPPSALRAWISQWATRYQGLVGAGP